MSSHTTASSYFRRQLRLRLAVLAVVIVSISVGFEGADRNALLVAMVLLTALTVRTVYIGGPRDARDYLLDVCFALALVGMLTALALTHLSDDPPLLALMYGCGALALMGGAILAARLTSFVTRLPRLLEGEERSRAFAIGTTELDERRTRAALVVTDRRLLLAAPDGARPRVAAQWKLAAVDHVHVRATDGVANLELEADGALLSIHRVPRGQALRVAAGLRESGDRPHRA